MRRLGTDYEGAETGQGGAERGAFALERCTAVWLGLGKLKVSDGREQDRDAWKRWCSSSRFCLCRYLWPKWVEWFSISLDKTSIDCTSEEVHFRPTRQHSAQEGVGAQLLFDIKCLVYNPWRSYSRPSLRLPSAITSLWLRRLQRPNIWHRTSSLSENISVHASLLPSWHLLF